MFYVGINFVDLYVLIYSLLLFVAGNRGFVIFYKVEAMLHA